MSNCNISNNLRFLPAGKIKAMSMEELTNNIMDSTNTGFYYDTSEIVDIIQKKIGEDFSPQSFINYFENKINNNKVFSEHPFFSKDLNILFNNAPSQLNYLNQTFGIDLMKLVFIDPSASWENKLTLNESQLNNKIYDYKNKLLKNIYDYLVENIPSFDIEYKPIYSNGRYLLDNSYQSLLDKLVELFNNFDPGITSIYNQQDLKQLTAYNSAIILSNFDKLIETNYGSVLSINQKNIGALNNPVDNFHYFLEFKGAYIEYWSKDSHEAASIENFTPKVLDTVVRTIPLYDSSNSIIPGQYLGMNRLYYIGALLKTLNKEFDINFQDNPKKYLKEFLKKLKESGKIEYTGAINSLYNYLYGYKSNVANIIDNAKIENPNIADSILDIEALIAHSINNMSPLIYSTYELGEDRTLLDMVGRETKSDEVLDFISRNIIDNVVVDGYSLEKKQETSARIWYNGRIQDTNIFITSISGLVISPAIERAYKQTSSALTIPIEEVYFKIYKIAQDINKNNVTDLKNIREKLSSDGSINALVSSIISASLPSAVMNVVDSNGNKIPTIGQSNLASEIKTSLDIAQNNFTEDSKNYFILNNRNLIKSSEVLLEVSSERNNKDVFKLSPSESFNLNFIENFVKPLLKPFLDIKKETTPISIKLTNFSDKGRIYNLGIDQNHVIFDLNKKGDLVTTGKSLKSMSNEEIKNLSKKSLNLYYSQLEKLILSEWGRLVNSNGEKVFKNPSIKLINNYLQTNPNLDSLIRSSWEYYNKKGENFEFTEEVHYSKYNNGYGFNNIIKTFLEKSSEEGDINTIFENQFIQKLFEIGATIPLKDILQPNSEILNTDIIPDNIKEIQKQMNVDLTNWINNKKFVFYKIKENGKWRDIVEPKEFDKNKEYQLNPILSKWLHTQNLIRYSYLGVVTGHEFLHQQKAGLSSDNKEFIKELTSRAVAMTKRMVIYPATQEYYLRGLPESPPEKAKLAVVKDTPASVWTYTGINKNIDSMDGAVQSNPFFTYLLKRSIPGKSPKNTQKIIGHSFNGTHSTLLKCALFSISNETIRMSFSSDLSHNKLMQKMNNVSITDIDISRLPNGNLIDIGTIAENTYYKLGSQYIRVKALEKISENEYNITYGYFEGKNSEEITVKKVKVNNLYDLYQIFGGAFSLSKKSNKYDWSEGSIDIVGKLITLNPELKNRMVHMVAQKSAVKNGASNINSEKVLKNDSNQELMWSNFDTHFLGIQLDAYHTSDEAMINEISQLLAALAQKQSTPELYKDLYKAVGEIVGKEIESYKKKYKIGDSYNIPKITEDFTKYLLSKEQIGNSLEIIKILEQNGIKKIPFSNSNFFNSFVTSIMSKLKSDFVKRKYFGLAAPLNPSFGSIQLFENDLGITYFAHDLLEKAITEDYPSSEVFNNVTEYNQLLLNNIINRLFPNKPITSFYVIKPLDRLLINGKEFYLDNLKDYYRVKKALLNNTLSELKEFEELKVSEIKVEKIVNKPRDLKPVEITFTQNKINKNVFDLDAVKLMYAYKTKTLTEEQKFILEKFANYIGLYEISENKEYFEFKLNSWVNRSFELLSLNRSYNDIIDSTSIDFQNYFNGDDLNEKIKPEYLINSTEIENLNHKEAEIILPKRYRSEFNLGTDSFSKITEEKENYFKNKLNSTFTPKTKDVDLYLFSSNKESLYISILNQFDVNNVLVDEKTGKEFKYVEASIITKEIENEDGVKKLYRVDIRGNILYELPSFKTKSGITHAKIYNKEYTIGGNDGIEYIVFENRPGVFDNIKDFIRSSKSNFDVIYPFGANVVTEEEFKELWSISKNYSRGNVYRNLLRPLDIIETSDNLLSMLSSLTEVDYKGIKLSEYFIQNFDSLKSKLVTQLSKTMYSSWEKTNHVVASRIPLQAMQSFMSMANKGYIEDEGNNVYVSHIQLFLQGSDLDIDKTYVLMHSIKNSLYDGWSPFFNYGSPEELKISEKLPIPNGITYEYSDNENDSIDIKEFVKLLEGTKYLPTEELVKLFNKVKKYNKIFYSPINQTEINNYNRILGLINKHNTYEYSSDSLKNFVVRNTIETSNDPKNQVASYSPIDNGKYNEIKKKSDNIFTAMLGDGISMDQQQENNAIGKEVIGIAANGVKVYFSLVDYFTDYYEGDIKNIDSQYFEREFTIDFVKNPINNKITKQRTVKVNRIAGLNLTKEAAKILNDKIYSILDSQTGELKQEIDELRNKIDLHDLFNTNKDASLVLSSLLSIATDNAKELILKAINASTEFASMHVYLIMLGFDEGKVANYIKGEDATKVLKALDQNMFINRNKIVTLDDAIKNTPISEEFRKIYKLSKELTFIAKGLKINQGLKADAYEIYSYFKGLEKEFFDREFEYNLSDQILNNPDLFVQEILKDKPYLSNSIPDIKNTLDKSKKLNIIKQFSIDRFFDDEMYRKTAIEYYNLIKGTFNVLDIFTKLEHYWNVMVATKMVYDQIKEVSNKFFWMTEELPLILNQAKIENNVDSSQSNFTIGKTNRDNYNYDQFKGGLNTFDELIISSFISSEMSKKPIDLAKVSKDLNQKIFIFERGNFKEVKEGDYITFQTAESLLDFKNLMEQKIIPHLKTKINNPLISSLVTRSAAWNRARTWLTTKIHVGKVTNPENGAILEEYQKGMDALSNEKIVLGNYEFYIDDLLFLYNLIVNKDKPGKDRLTKLFGNYIGRNNSLASKFYQYYTEIESDLTKAFDRDLTREDRKWIMFSVLNKKGLLNYSNDIIEGDIRLPNINIPVSVKVKSVYDNSIKMKQFQDILNKIAINEILIDFNCE